MVVVTGAIMTSVVGCKILFNVLGEMVSCIGLLAITFDGLGDVLVCDILGRVFVCCVRG